MPTEREICSGALVVVDIRVGVELCLVSNDHLGILTYRLAICSRGFVI